MTIGLVVGKIVRLAVTTVGTTVGLLVGNFVGSSLGKLEYVTLKAYTSQATFPEPSIGSLSGQHLHPQASIYNYI